MAAPLRRERVASQIRDELSDIVQHELCDPRVGWTTVTRVEMSPDLCHAKVFISVYGDEEARKQTFEALARAAGFIRRELGRRVRMRVTPEIHWKADESFELSHRVGEILKTIHIPPEEGAAGQEPSTRAKENDGLDDHDDDGDDDDDDDEGEGGSGR